MDVTKRFNTRADDYVKYRPNYPQAIYDFLWKEVGVLSSFTVADVGCGTGIFTKGLVDRCQKIVGIDPSQKMLDQARIFLGERDNLDLILGTGENLPLSDNSVDGILCAQAFHWFDLQGSKKEFRRVARSNAPIVFIWNDRKTSGNKFLAAYDYLIRAHGTDYAQVNHREVTKGGKIQQFFGCEPEYFCCDNQQIFDFEGLLGRLTSSSYMPNRGEAGFESMASNLKTLFDQNQKKGTVTIEYDCKLYWSRF